MFVALEEMAVYFGSKHDMDKVLNIDSKIMISLSEYNVVLLARIFDLPTHFLREVWKGKKKVSII